VDIWGDGSARRDFLHSADLADIASLFMGNDFTGPINIGSGTTVAIRDIAKLLSDISGVEWSDVRFDTSKPTGRPECYSDLSKLHALGWQPKVSFADGLRSTYDWYSVRHTRS
jgi:GDP-L-fucose synthase